MAEDATQIWDKLVSSEQKKTLEWTILKYLGKIVRIACQKSFSHNDIAELDKCIWLHDKLWLGSPELQHTWKPKNHYLSHLPFEILRWGPLVGYWCEPFEHENQYTKRSAGSGNYANVLFSSSEGKALLVALQTMEMADPSLTPSPPPSPPDPPPPSDPPPPPPPDPPPLPDLPDVPLNGIIPPAHWPDSPTCTEDGKDHPKDNVKCAMLQSHAYDAGQSPVKPPRC